MAYTVKAVCDRNSLNEFLELPRQLYRSDPNWVAPIISEVRRTLDVSKNPYFRGASLDLLVCYDDGRPVARTAIVTNLNHWQKFHEKTAFFGFFESANDPEASQVLFERAQQVCRDRGAEALEGPFNPNHYSELGLQINRFGTTPAFFQTYNPEYYPHLMHSAGFGVSKTVHTRKNPTIQGYILRRYGAVPRQCTSGPYSVRCFRMNDFDAELERIREVFNDAFSSNWHFLPLTHDEYTYSAKFLNLVTFPSLITIVEHLGEPVGVLECVLDINPLLKKLNGRVSPLGYWQYLRARKSVRSLIIYAVGIKRAFQGTRVYKLMLDSLCSQLMAYETLETTWMSEENLLALRAAEHLGLERDKEFAIYRKIL